MSRLRWIIPALLAAPAALLAHDYPTADRVLYVQACMREHPGGFYETLNKCSCVIDTIARELPYDDFVTMSTMINAISMAGERGNAIRDAEPLHVQMRKFRQLQTQAGQHCFLGPAAPH
jgi:hypothetical protein